MMSETINESRVAKETVVALERNILVLLTPICILTTGEELSVHCIHNTKWKRLTQKGCLDPCALR